MHPVTSYYVPSVHGVLPVLDYPNFSPFRTIDSQEIPPFETKGVMRASFSSRDADNHTAFIRIKTNASDPDQFIILPVEVEVTSGRPLRTLPASLCSLSLCLTHVLCPQHQESTPP